MSKLFFDHLINFKDLELHIHAVAETPEEKEELWQLIDEILHHRVLGCILDNLELQHHEAFLDKFHSFPHDERLINYLDKLMSKDTKIIIKEETESLLRELIELKE